jgi:hypothetical protein
MRRSSTLETKKEDGSPGGAPEKTFTTKTEYNRWLVSQEKWQMAEEQRTQAKQGEDYIKERARKHTAQGLSRQQAAAVQMKKASESLEAHREKNLTMGRAVYEEVSGWRQGAKATKDNWASYGKQIRDQTKAANKTGEAKETLSQNKKQQAAVTREDDQKKEKAHKDQKDAERDRVKKQADKVRSETSSEVTDTAKRFFYDQRLKSAQDTKANAAKWEKERKEEAETFNQAQTRRRIKSKTARSMAGKSREALKTSRTDEAVALRAEKKRLAEQHRQRLQDDYQARAATVKGVISNSFLQPPEATGEGGSPLAGSFYSLTNIRSPSPTRAAPEGE